MSTAKNTHQHFGPILSGVVTAVPFIFVITPIAVLFGVLATQAGLSVFEATAFSAIVLAGAAQFTALQLMQDNAPLFIIIASATAVNLRMTMYSAALTPHFGAAPTWLRAIIAFFTVDQTFALSSLRFEEKPSLSLSQKVKFFLAAAFTIAPFWYAGTILGAMGQKNLPDWVPLDFALPLSFLAMIGPLLRTYAHICSAITAVVLALLLNQLPLNLGLFLGGLGGIIVGAEIERQKEKKHD